MPLLNYTTEVPADKTVGQIQAMLAKSGAMAIMTEFSDEGVLVGVSFKIRTAHGPVAYSLPCDMDAVLRILTKQGVSHRYRTTEQAARVGWRIIKDWIEAQLALVQTQMVTIDEVFLPYARTSNGETVYQRYVGSGMTGLLIEDAKR